jgi:branched-chain amino acid transport system ATP-binding protein
MMILSVKNVSVNYGKVAALRGVSFDVERGRIVTLIGANGAGKSTTLKTISGLGPIASGEIYFEGKRIDRLLPQQIVKIGISHVPEGRRLFPSMTVMDNLEMGAFLRNNKRDIKNDLERAFKYFPVLSTRRKQRAGSLSGGEQQMLAIGRSLMAKPTLMLLDEPSIGLSPIMSRTIAKILNVINREGVSILLVEQNAKMALKLAHKGYVLETGRLVLGGTATELLSNEAVKSAYLGV